jgi:hypothetical protein
MSSTNQFSVLSYLLKLRLNYSTRASAFFTAYVRAVVRKAIWARFH